MFRKRRQAKGVWHKVMQEKKLRRLIPVWIQEDAEQTIAAIHRQQEPQLLLFETAWWRRVFPFILLDKVAHPEIWSRHSISVYRDWADIQAAKRRTQKEYMMFFFDTEERIAMLYKLDTEGYGV
jgi:hypothetical protein